MVWCPWFSIHRVSEKFSLKMTSKWLVTSIYVTNFRVLMFWWQLLNAGDGFDHSNIHYLSLQHTLISVWHQHSKLVINIQTQSPTSTNCHQLLVANITINSRSVNNLAQESYCDHLKSLTNLYQRYLRLFDYSYVRCSVYYRRYYISRFNYGKFVVRYGRSI